MDRGIPTPNRECTRRWEDYRDFIHEKNKRTVRPMTDNSVPSTYNLGHMLHNAKKDQIMSERYAEIDYQNKYVVFC